MRSTLPRPLAAVSIPLLRRDHVNFSLILNALERQVDGISQGRPLSTQLFKLAIRYFRDYPRKVHHPKEDVIYGALAQHLPHDPSHLFHVLQDHRELADQLTVLDATLAGYDPAITASVETLCEATRAFIARERQHMEREEAHLYPVAVHQLSREEWDKIEAQFEGEADTFFNADAEAAYDRLLQDLLSRDNAKRGAQGH